MLTPPDPLQAARGSRAALLRTALAAAALVLLALPCSARAQYMSCGAFLELDESLKHVYVTGFVEGVTYTELELSQLVSNQAKQKDLQDGEKLVLNVMQRVASNIAQAVPSGLTVEEVTDRLKELCSGKEKANSAFVNIYSEYSLALRQAARVRTEQKQEGTAAAQPAPPGAAPAAQTKTSPAAGAKPKAAAPKPGAAAPPGAPPAPGTATAPGAPPKAAAPRRATPKATQPPAPPPPGPPGTGQPDAAKPGAAQPGE